ncbi:MAG: hypothetical protein EOO81_05680 [Oxalobacteraceae bacterium]|nr:MAG: hypothetical protein EOO81_05680 [Oxalobacteraceae bacterium]
MCAFAISSSSLAFGAETITYSYDVHGRLISVVHAGSVNNGVNATYGYDASDNRTNVTVQGSPNPAPS